MSEENVISNVEDNSPKNEGVVEKVIEIFKNGWNKQVILYGPPGTSKTYSRDRIEQAHRLQVVEVGHT